VFSIEAWGGREATNQTACKEAVRAGRARRRRRRAASSIARKTAHSPAAPRRRIALPTLPGNSSSRVSRRARPTSENQLAASACSGSSALTGFRRGASPRAGSHARAARRSSTWKNAAPPRKTSSALPRARSRRRRRSAVSPARSLSQRRRVAPRRFHQQVAFERLEPNAACPKFLLRSVSVNKARAPASAGAKTIPRRGDAISANLGGQPRQLASDRATPSIRSRPADVPSRDTTAPGRAPSTGGPALYSQRR
jgi:hypothetical protein